MKKYATKTPSKLCNFTVGKVTVGKLYSWYGDLTFSMLTFYAITFIFCHLILYMRRSLWHGSIRLWLIKLNTIKLIQLNLGVYWKMSLLWSSKTKWKLMFLGYSLLNKTDFCTTLYLWSAYIFTICTSQNETDLRTDNTDFLVNVTGKEAQRETPFP